jgi:uncharacterized protein YgiB involved in biofilm formation
MRHRLILIVCLFLPPTTPASAESNKLGKHVFGSEYSCRSSGEVSEQICSNAAANSTAEFNEKAPRFSARAECEQVFRDGCSVGIKGAAGWEGKKSGIYFQPRQRGFAVQVLSEQNITVTPLTAGGRVKFSSRSALGRNVRVDHKAAQLGNSWPREGDGALEKSNSGAPVERIGSVPPRPPSDPNFDCSSVIEPDGKDPSTGCYPAPSR